MTDREYWNRRARGMGGRSEPPRFFDVEYPIPAAVVAGKETVNVRFVAKGGSQIATVFGLRMIRGDARR